MPDSTVFPRHPIEFSGGGLKIGDTRIIASTGEQAAADQVAAAARENLAPPIDGGGSSYPEPRP